MRMTVMTTNTCSRRIVCFSFLSSALTGGKDIAAAASGAAAFLPTTTPTTPTTPTPSRKATFVTSSTLPLFMAAAPGVQVSDPLLIQQALQLTENNKDSSVVTMVVDVRGVDEIQANGYWKVGGHVKWVHAQCTLDGGCPLLSVASDALLGPNNKAAPVVLYCASGKRAALAQQVLTSLGYTNVLNAGGFPSDTDKIALLLP
jgi:rhodanese-related sulfurtransferase